jgi:hypothetical protein
VLLAWSLATACSHQPKAPPDLSNPGELASAQAEMTPARMLIHPLTRVGTDASGQPALLLYIELRDRFGQNARALGMLHVVVQHPGRDPISAGSGGGTPGLDAMAWDVDLRDPDQNALLYDDLITRTYRLTLTGLPEWLTEWAAKQAEGASPGGSPTVIATFTFPDPRSPAINSLSVSDSERLGR